VGCDVDPDRVAFAQREYAAQEFVACGPDAAPFADHSFDVVVSAVVIHFVPDHRAYLDEVRRLVRPNGHLLIVCKNQSVVRNAFRRLVGKNRAASKLWVPSQAEVQSVLAEAGFVVIDSTYFYDPPFEGWKNFGDWVFGSIEQLLSVMRIKGPAGYHAYLARRNDG
jgi:SAM-dependent methyltransferase